MSRFVAVEWDAAQARYVVAEKHGRQATIEAAGCVARPDDAANPSAIAWASALSAALAPYKVARAKTLVCIDRGQVELLNLTVPPAGDVELPELVRNEAQRASSTIVDETALDFVVLGDDVGQPRQVAAVAMSKSALDEVVATCGAAGLTPSTVALRPYAAAACFLANPAERQLTCLLINVCNDVIDLSVVAAGKVVYWRTVRQAGASTDPAAAKKLVGEISRTLVVAGNQLHGEAIEGIYLFGTLDEHPALWEQLRDSMTQPCALVDPFMGHQPAAGVPEQAGCYSALVGLVVAAAQGERPAIDLLHPRRRPAPPDRRRTFTLAGAAAALVVLLGGYAVWSEFTAIDEENQQLAERLSQLNDDFKRAGKQQKLIQAVNDWRADDVNWLDELRDLSLRFPSGRDAVVLRMGLNHGRGDGATIDMVGVVRDPAIVNRLETDIRDKYHQISSRHVQERVQDKGYTWHFESSLKIAPRDKKLYISHLPAELQPAAEPAQPARKPVPPIRSAAKGEAP